MNEEQQDQMCMTAVGLLVMHIQDVIFITDIQAQLETQQETEYVADTQLNIQQTAHVAVLILTVEYITMDK